MLRPINPELMKLLLTILGYPLAALIVAMGAFLTTDAFTPPLARSKLSTIEGVVISADRVIRRRAPVRPHDTYQQSDTYSIRFVIEHGGRQDTFWIPEPRLGQQDIPDLLGAHVTALINGPSEFWELKTPRRTFFTYDDTFALQISGKRQAVYYGPMLLAVGGLCVWMSARKRRGVKYTDKQQAL